MTPLFPLPSWYSFQLLVSAKYIRFKNSVRTCKYSLAIWRSKYKEVSFQWIQIRKCYFCFPCFTVRNPHHCTNFKWYLSSCISPRLKIKRKKIPAWLTGTVNNYRLILILTSHKRYILYAFWCLVLHVKAGTV